MALIRHKAEKAKKPKKSQSEKSHKAKKATKRKKPRSQKSHEAKKATKPKMPQSRKATKPKMQHLFFTEFLVGIVKLLIFLYIHDVAPI